MFNFKIMSKATLFGTISSYNKLNSLRKTRPLLQSWCSSRYSSSKMLAVVIKEFGGADVLKLKEIDVPVPLSTEILVKVKAAGINPVDTYIRQGEFMVLPELPTVLGKEAAGIVEEVGSDVQGIKVGDRVVCCLPYNGGYAEYVKCDPKFTFPLSEKLTFSQGAALYVAYFTAYRALITQAKIEAGQSLLVHGASGAVGTAAVQIAKRKGLKVVGTAGTEEGMKVVKSVGADHVFNHRAKGYSLETFASTKAAGFDVILENCAHINLDMDLTLLNQKGRILIVGSRGTIEINPRSLMYTEGFITGVKLLGVTPEEFNETVQMLLQGIEEGWVRPVVAKEYNMRFAKKAHEELIDNKSGSRGKRVFVM